MAFWDTIGSVVDSAGDWLGSSGANGSSNWMNMIGAGVSLYDNYLQNKQRDRVADYYQEQEQQNYDDTVAYRDWLESQGEEGGGGGSKLDPALVRQAMAEQSRLSEQARQYYRPYHESGLRVLPQMEGAYTQGIQSLLAMQKMASDPQAQKRIKEPLGMYGFNLAQILPQRMVKKNG